MYALKCEKNMNSFYEPHLVLQNTSESIGEKEAAAFWGRFLEENRRNDLSVLLSHYSGCMELLEQVLKIWLRIFLKKSSNFVQKAQPICFSIFHPLEIQIIYQIL